MPSGNNERLNLLLWKNWRLKIHRPVRFAFEFITPILVVFLVVICRSFFHRAKMTATVFDEFQLDRFQISSHQLVYSPNQSTVVQELVKSIEELLGNDITGYKTEEEILNKLHLETKLCAAIIFPSSYNDLEKLPKSVVYKLRFPTELKKTEGQWMTNSIGPDGWKLDPQDPTWKTQFPGYYQEGFLSLQNAVSTSILAKHPNYDGSTFPEISLRRFPHPEYYADAKMPHLYRCVSASIVFGFLLPVMWLINDISVEKEKGLKEAMKLMGIGTYIHWSAWFFITLIIMSITMFVILLIFKVSFWHPTSLYPESDALLLYLFLFTYAMAMITFCFTMGVIFQSSKTAGLFGSIIFLATYFPVLFVGFVEDVPRWSKYVTCLFFNSAMTRGLDIIVSFEITRKGAHVENLFENISYGDKLTLGYIMISLVGDSIIHLLIAYYLENLYPGKYGLPKKWWYIFTCRRKTEPLLADKVRRGRLSQISEQIEYTPRNTAIALETQNLSKSFQQSPRAVYDLNMTLYSNEITTIIGPMGSGKSVIFAMLSGKERPTAGKIIFMEEELSLKHFTMYKGIGFCPKHNILFEHLSFADNIELYSRLKGVLFPEYYHEISVYADFLGIDPHMLVKNMPVGMQRWLAVAIAFCGSSSLVIVDEPSIGLDHPTRLAIWDLIYGQREGRSILILSRLIDETDQADRIAILSHGELQCYGSREFIFRKYGEGYHITLVKKPEFDLPLAMEVFERILPTSDFVLTTETTREAKFTVDITMIAQMPDLFKALESNLDELGVEKIQISDISLEEIYLRVGTDHTEKVEGRQSTKIFRKVKQNQIYFNRLLAMILKIIFYVKHSILRCLFCIICPIIFFMALFGICEILKKQGEKLPSMNITLEVYSWSTILLHSSSHSDLEKFTKEYLKPQVNLTTVDSDMLLFLCTLMSAHLREVLLYYQVAIELTSDKIVMWFNTVPYHTPPLALNIAHNIFLKSLDNASEIQVFNHPLPFSMSAESEAIFFYSFIFALAMVTGLWIVSGFYTCFYVNERKTRVKHLQFISGVDMHIYWCVHFCTDLIAYSCSVGILLAWMSFYQLGVIENFKNLVTFIVIMCCFAYTLFPAIYLLSLKCNTTVSQIIIFLNFLPFIVMYVFWINRWEPEETLHQKNYLFCVSGIYAVLLALAKFYAETSRVSDCLRNIDNCLKTGKSEEGCWESLGDLVNRCRDREDNTRSFHRTGIYRELVALLILGTFFWIFLFIQQSRIAVGIIYLCRAKKNYRLKKVNDDDVEREMDLVRNLNQQDRKNYSVVLRDVVHQFKKKMAVRGVCLAIEPYECFVLLGPKDSGKTSVFKMITGELMMSSGQIYVNGKNMKLYPVSVHQTMGYCPQHDALFVKFTVRETLLFFGLLKGYRWRDRHEFIEHFANRLDFSHLLNTRVLRLNQSDKRKLNVAISIMGDPYVICMDEPTNGMDAAATKISWEAIREFRSHGKCVIVATPSMEECEALATRTGILISGQLGCLGTPQDLRIKFTRGFMLVFRLLHGEDDSETEEDYTTQTTLAIHQEVIAKFPTAIMHDFNTQIVTYNVPSEMRPWSEIFANLLELRGSKLVEDVSITQMSLQHIYLKLSSIEGIQ